MARQHVSEGLLLLYSMRLYMGVNAVQYCRNDNNRIKGALEECKFEPPPRYRQVKSLKLIELANEYIQASSISAGHHQLCCLALCDTKSLVEVVPTGMSGTARTTGRIQGHELRAALTT